ncbi:helix-turn-helix domain-containing protein [Rhodovulum kholense]|uniref:DNA-binding XRE family transcriptional regulator n=1 Tax=Rhodovulum kholense TaxID=453584 RepID=A0A8E2VIL0_9RHOB|nr:helix-turn-helix transcriptional regulator [Rhodovulum kholense]PTW43916.1 DNA-binding XRE family transcriptional regulator [Rhodovulum kholense]
MNDMVSIPREEYERLREAAEELEDILAYDRAKARDEESVPHEFVTRIIDGEHPVRVFRDWRGMSAADLSRSSGVNRVQIHEIETGKKNGSVQTLKKIAEALGVTVDDLI